MTDKSNRMEQDFEIVLETSSGKMTGVFVSNPISLIKNVYTAWIKEKPGVIVQADSVDEAIDDLYVALAMMLEVEKSMKEQEEIAKMDIRMDEIFTNYDYRN